MCSLSIIVAVPIIVLEIIIFSLWMYWMTGFVAEAGRFFFFILTLLSSSLALSTFFRSISYVTPNPDVARQMDLPFIIIFVIFGGFPHTLWGSAQLVDLGVLAVPTELGLPLHRVERVQGEHFRHRGAGK